MGLAAASAVGEVLEFQFLFGIKLYQPSRGSKPLEGCLLKKARQSPLGWPGRVLATPGLGIRPVYHFSCPENPLNRLPNRTKKDETVAINPHYVT